MLWEGVSGKVISSGTTTVGNSATRDVSFGDSLMSGVIAGSVAGRACLRRRRRAVTGSSPKDCFLPMRCGPASMV